MIRSLLCLAALTYCSSSALPEEKPTPLYYPIQEGAKRVMVKYAELHSEEVFSECVEIINKVESKDGKHLLDVTFSYNIKGFKRELKRKIEVSSHEISLIGKDNKITTPSILLKLPAKPGTTWKTDSTTFTIGNVEEVEVPAGKFKAVVVKSEDNADGVKVAVVEWYAAGIGVVKSTTKIDFIESTFVLKSFTPGK